MTNTYQSPSEEYMDAETTPTLIPSRLWSVAYLGLPGHLEAASQINPIRVGEVFADVSPKTPALLSNPSPAPAPSVLSPRVTAPCITPYDGSAKNLRIFCSTLRNQFLGQESFFPDEISKVRFAYQCLGPGALSKMQSCFRCLEDPTVPSEINSLDEFMAALKRECEDPELRDKATRAVEQMTQQNMRFHEFIKLFHDKIADSTYANLDKNTWKTILERRLSCKLREILLSASDIPSDYYEFVAYLRRKDAAIQEWQTAFPSVAVSSVPTSEPGHRAVPIPIPTSRFPEPTVSQGGSAMDLDLISRQKTPEGRLTQQAKEARRALGRCIRCNRLGHMVRSCPLRSKVSSLATVDTAFAEKTEELKE